MRCKLLSTVIVVIVFATSLPRWVFCADPKLPTIGVIAPLSGAYASFGNQIKDGIELAAGSDVKLIFEDSQFDIKTALSAYRKLTSIHKIDFLISAGGETCGVLNRESQRDQLVHIAVGCNTETFNNPDSFNFRVDVNEAIAAEKLATYLRKAGVNTLAIINIENAWGTTVTKFAVKAFNDVGIKVTNHVAFQPSDAGNLRSILEKVRQTMPERLFIVSSPETFALILKQLAEIHLESPVVSTISVENPQFIELAKQKSNGIIYLSVKDNPIPKAQHPDFYSRFPTKNTFTAWGYDAVLLLKAASKQPDAKVFLQNIRNFVGAFNVYNYDSRGELSLNYEIRTIKDGQYTFFDEVE
jgi:branched-chain amino acid transport system substrate-binding protein